MSTRLGVDLGTTWTAAAVAGDRGIEPLQLGTHGAAIPSVVAVEGDRVLVGESAERHLLTSPPDGAREFKRRLGDETPYLLGGSPYGAEALMGKVLAQVVATATEREGGAPSEVVLTHPATWGGYKLDLLREAGRVAGLDGVTLLGEPQAAALHYVRLGRVAAGDVVAVYDFGGGTFDVAIVRCGEVPELLGAPEGLERLGGIDLDHAVFAHVNAVLGGQLQELDGNDPEVARGVVRLRAACTAAKEALSADNDATIEVLLPGLSTQVRMTRGELEDAVRPRLDDTIAAVERAVGSAGLDSGDLAGVLLVGGSSRIPLVNEYLAARLGRPVLVDADPKLVVALGAAGAAAGAVPAMAGAVAAAGVGAAAASAAGSGSGGAGGTGGGQGSGISKLKKAPERGSSSVSAGIAAAGVAAAGAAAVGGMAVTGRGLFADDGDGDKEAAVDELIPDPEAVEGESLDAFDDGIGGAGPGTLGGGGGGGGGVRVAGGGSGGGGGGRAGGAARAREQDRDDDFARPLRPRPGEEPVSTGGVTPSPSAADLDVTRAELRARLENLARPEGADDAEFADLRSDLDGLLDRFQPSSGQTLDAAVAGLRMQFEDRVRDFAQDQRIDAILDRQQAEDAVAAEVDTFKADVRDRLANWQPPAGTDPAEAAAMRDRLNAMVDRFNPVPGQTAQEALADLRERFDDEVGDFAQDLRIDALVEQARGEQPPADGATTEGATTDGMPADGTATEGTTTDGEAATTTEGETTADGETTTEGSTTESTTEGSTTEETTDAPAGEASSDGAGMPGSGMVDEFDVQMAEAETSPDTASAAEVPAGVAVGEMDPTASRPNPAVTMTSEDLVGDDITGATGVMTAPAPAETAEAATSAATDAAAAPEAATTAPDGADMADPFEDITGAAEVTTAVEEAAAATDAADEVDEEPAASEPEPDAAADLSEAMPTPLPELEPDAVAAAMDAAPVGEPADLHADDDQPDVDAGADDDGLPD